MQLRPLGTEPLELLLLGAHCDDIEIGCGATLLKLRESGQACNITWVTFSGSETRQSETTKSADRFLGQLSASTKVIFGEYRESHFPSKVGELKDMFEDIKSMTNPDLILTHYRDDRHQDHRVISDVTWNTWRSHTILEYEIPKFDGDLGQPNVFIGVSRETADEKAEILMECYQSQLSKEWFSPDTFTGLMRLRGIESGTQEPMAEAFYGRKTTLSFGH